VPARIRHVDSNECQKMPPPVIIHLSMEADDQWNSAVPLQNLRWYEVRLAGVCLTYRPPIGICTRGQGQTTSRSYPVLGAESPAAELAVLCSNRLHSGCCRALLSELNLHSEQSLVQDI
jgi:hypothetical protein